MEPSLGPLEESSEEVAHPLGGCPAGGEHLLVVERVAGSPAARLVTSEMPSTSRPASRAAIASSAVDMPTRSAPRMPAIRTSAGVSYCGPGNIA